ncbi:hypothetical protein [Lentzea albida]|nr:hypothetical protein [Lentzea albida]
MVAAGVGAQTACVLARHLDVERAGGSGSPFELPPQIREHSPAG